MNLKPKTYTLDPEMKKNEMASYGPIVVIIAYLGLDGTYKW